MASAHPQRWARCPAHLAWTLPGFPTGWVRVLDQHPEGAQALPGYVWLDMSGKVRHLPSNNLEFTATPPPTHHPKPARPFGHFIFPKDREPTFLGESLPTRKEDLEAAVVRKFIDALGQRFDRRLNPEIIRGTEPADLVSDEAGRRIEIQVTEVVNLEHARGGRIYRENLPESVDRVRQLLTECIGLKLAKNG